MAGADGGLLYLSSDLPWSSDSHFRDNAPCLAVKGVNEILPFVAVKHLCCSESSKSKVSWHLLTTNSSIRVKSV